MNRGLYTSAIGMMTQMNNLDVITNNIANVDNTGFKKDMNVVQSFSEELMKRFNDPEESLVKVDNNIGSVSLGNFVAEVNTDFSTGSMKKTGGTYDLAINGDGFFAIETMDNGNIVEKYTRDGSFTVNSNNELMTKEGNYVLGENGRIVIPNGKITISENGNIYSNNEFVDKLKIVDFENKETLRKYGDNLYNKIDESVEKPFTGTILQSQIEMSNVNAVQEMVKMIAVSRAYELNQKMVQSHDAILGRAVNDIAKK
ncbi:flagellar basal-body rod protein FlgF [uncultured Tyzzerella sp.]|uniref:flagellar basal-body rod protein FlgF n=1 Tax=uncultured Tyzzerella sp. TaxID=2321398 RepID=UPI002942D11C|nr:flagellar basal-body rod protein FlgF [uncultured Tyzzerella sp.]